MPLSFCASPFNGYHSASLKTSFSSFPFSFFTYSCSCFYLLLRTLDYSRGNSRSHTSFAFFLIITFFLLTFPVSASCSFAAPSSCSVIVTFAMHAAFLLVHACLNERNPC
ncbi:uncharacterized protein DS421_20g687330 [Arachis hypogaea]|nr:uncharacterized protein DS421_20g687330 [Arachis hypogaea]